MAITSTHTCDTCRINLEAECAAGEFEAWEPKEPEDDHGH